MESQGQGHTTWDTRDRRATPFEHKQGGGATEPLSLPARKDEPALTNPGLYYRPPLARKKAVHDFRVRWPELILLEQKKKEELPLIGKSTSDKQVHVASACSSEVSISNTDLESSPSERLDSKGAIAVSPQPLPAQSPYMTILNSYLNPESMTRLEKKVRNRTMVAMQELEQEMEAVKSRRSALMMDLKEIACGQTEDKHFLEYLKQRKEESQRKYDSLWKDYRQQCQEIEDRRRELVCTFTSRTADLQKQLMQGRKLEAGLRRKLKALEPIAQIKESQDRRKQALEQEKANIAAHIPFIDREAHIQFLKERTALEKQVEELNLLESGEHVTRELRKKTKALEAVAKQAQKDFCLGINAENRRLQTQLRQLDEEVCELEARREKLEQRKQRWKEQQWYLEALARGRQRLQQREYRLPKPQAPHPTQGHLLGARPGTNPK
ncbi:Coiled-coil domain-containing protein 121 [Lemmus lemmus]